MPRKSSLLLCVLASTVINETPLLFTSPINVSYLIHYLPLTLPSKVFLSKSSISIDLIYTQWKGGR